MKRIFLSAADLSMQLISGILFAGLITATIISTAARTHRDYKAGKLDD